MSRASVVSIAVLLILVLVCFARLVADPSSLIVDADRPSLDHARTVEEPSIGNDLTRLFLPHHLAISRSIARTGHLPLWDDRGFGGRPMVGNPQAGLFYPPVWLAWWIGQPSLLGWITVGHLLFSGIGAFRLARTLGMAGWGSLMAAGCVQSSPYVLSQTFEGHYPHVWAASWYPWAFDAAIRVRRGEPRSALVLGLILATTFLAGHPQEGYYLTLALGGWAVWDGLATLIKGDWRRTARLWGLWVVALSFAVGWIAVELIPDALAQPWCLQGARMPLRMAGRYHLYPINALQLLSPRAIGGPDDYLGHENYWETVTSIGLVPLVLAIVGAAWSGNRRAARGWLILVGLSLLFASGRKLGLFALMFEVVPGVDRFRVPARALFLASLGGSMLAGLGVEALRERWTEDQDWARLARRFGTVALLGLMTVELGGARSTWNPGSVEMGRGIPFREADRFRVGLARFGSDPVFLGSLAGTGLLLAIGWRVREARRSVAIALGLLGLVELAIHGQGLIVTTPIRRILGPDPISEALQSSRPAGLEPSRIRAVDTLYDDLRAGQAGFSKTNVNDSFQIQHAADLYESLYDLFDDDDRPRTRMLAPTPERRRAIRQSVLDRMSVSILVADQKNLESPWPLLVSGDWNGSPFSVYQNPTALPRAYVVPRARPAPDDPTILPIFPASNPRESVLMRSDPLGPEVSPRQAYRAAEWLSTDSDRIVIRVATEAPGLLVVTETWMPGWSAEVDGQPLPILRGNRAQQVIPLPRSGPHQIVLSYQPPGLRLGMTVSASTAFVWSILIVFSLRKNGRSSDDRH